VSDPPSLTPERRPRDGGSDPEGLTPFSETATPRGDEACPPLSSPVHAKVHAEHGCAMTGEVASSASAERAGEGCVPIEVPSPHPCSSRFAQFRATSPHGRGDDGARAPRPTNVIPAKAGTQSSLGLRYVCGGMRGASPAFNQSVVRVCLGDLGFGFAGMTPREMVAGPPRPCRAWLRHDAGMTRWVGHP
jgi:hypothetical protein